MVEKFIEHAPATVFALGAIKPSCAFLRPFPFWFLSPVCLWAVSGLRFLFVSLLPTPTSALYCKLYGEVCW